MLKSLPSGPYDLKSLATLILSGCSKFEQFPENFGYLEMLKKLYADGTALRELPSSLSSLRNLEILSFVGCKGPPSASWLFPRRSSNSTGFILHNLSGLCSLRKLDLSDCNLSDETNLSCLVYLSSLKDLYLCENNFVTLPNLSRLSRLERFRSVGKLHKTSRTARSPIKHCSSGCKKLHVIEKCLASKCPVIPSKESRNLGKFPQYPIYHNFNYRKCLFCIS